MAKYTNLTMDVKSGEVDESYHECIDSGEVDG